MKGYLILFVIVVILVMTSLGFVSRMIKYGRRKHYVNSSRAGNVAIVLAILAGIIAIVNMTLMIDHLVTNN